MPSTRSGTLVAFSPSTWTHRCEWYERISNESDDERFKHARESLSLRNPYCNAAPIELVHGITTALSNPSLGSAAGLGLKCPPYDFIFDTTKIPEYLAGGVSGVLTEKHAVLGEMTSRKIGAK